MTQTTAQLPAFGYCQMGSRFRVTKDGVICTHVVHRTAQSAAAAARRLAAKTER